MASCTKWRGLWFASISKCPDHGAGKAIQKPSKPCCLTSRRFGISAARRFLNSFLTRPRRTIAEKWCARCSGDVGLLNLSQCRCHLPCASIWLPGNMITARCPPPSRVCCPQRLTIAGRPRQMLQQSQRELHGMMVRRAIQLLE